MYRVDHRDKVIPLEGVPRATGDTYFPVVFANEKALLLAYSTDAPNVEDAVAVLTFGGTRAHYLGPPNVEALGGHPLASRGLSFYGVFEVQDSSWIRTLIEMNAVHPRHDPALFSALQHFIFCFEDTTFECIAKGFDATVVEGPLAKAVATVQNRLFS